jgi:hypothetical protein
MAIEIGYSVDELNKKFRDLQAELKKTNPELNALNAALKLDPRNVDLVQQKFAVFEEQINLNKEQALLLTLQMEALDQELANGEVSQNEYNLQIEKLEEKQKLATIAAEGLEDALSNQNKEVNKAKFGDLNEQLQNAQKSMKAMQGLTIGVSDAFKIWGVDISNTNKEADVMSKTFETLMGGMQMVSGILPQLQKLTAANTSAFERLTIGATLVFSSFQIFDGLLNQFDEDTRVVAGAITALIAVLAAGTVAWLAHIGTMSSGVAIPIILGAVGAGIAGIKAMIPAGDTVGGNVSTSRISTSNNIGSSNTNYQTPSQIAPANISYEAIEMAVYRAVSRVRNEDRANGGWGKAINAQQIRLALNEESRRMGGR